VMIDVDAMFVFVFSGNIFSLSFFLSLSGSFCLEFFLSYVLLQE